jgi:hypothetical protein
MAAGRPPVRVALSHFYGCESLGESRSNAVVAKQMWLICRLQKFCDRILF